MKITVKVNTPQGPYGLDKGEITATGHTLHDLLDKVLPLLDGVPAEIAGRHFIDWETITLTITRKQ